MSDIVNRVKELMKLPQELCHTCGKCCRIATFKGGYTYEQVVALSEKEAETEEELAQIDGAKDYLTIFEPYESTEAARKVAPEFVDHALKYYEKKDDEMSFFCCKYLKENNLCDIHEDRPQLCRMYPIPHERTFFNPGCGFEKQSKENLKEINKIIEQLKVLTAPIDYTKGITDGNNKLD